MSSFTTDSIAQARAQAQARANQLSSSSYRGETKQRQAGRQASSSLVPVAPRAQGETKSDCPMADASPYVGIAIPKEYCCPLSSLLMDQDPVVAADGFTYSRREIEKWLQNPEKKVNQRHVSPVTFIGLEHTNLSPNKNLHQVIQSFIANHLSPRATPRTTAASNNMPHQLTSSLQRLAKHFKGLDLIREELENTLGGWQPPVVVVFGQESCGKSTILERIAMVPLFPKGDNICTRLPILVSLRHSSSHHNPVLHTMERNRHGADRTTASVTISSEHEPHTIVQRCMLDVIRRENRREAGISQQSYLKLELSGPHLPNLDLLDLPGLVVNPASTEPSTMHDDTHALVDTTIQETEGRAVFLAVREISEKARTSQAIKVLERHPAIAGSTLGVFTKCDEVRRKKITAMMNEHTILRHGHVATMNAPPGEGEQTGLQAQAVREVDFFEEEGLAQLIADGRATCNALVHKISDVYVVWQCSGGGVLQFCLVVSAGD